MNLQLKGQAAIDAALAAMRSSERIELFGNRYTVANVHVFHRAVSDCIGGAAELTCITRHAELKPK